MATVQINGSSAVTSSSTRNNGGAAIQTGSAASGQLDKVNLGSYYSRLGVFGSTPLDGRDTNEANSSGTFAYNNTRPIAKRYTTTLSGVSNTFLLSGAAKPGLRRKVNKTESNTNRLDTTLIRSGGFNIFAGKFMNNQNGTTVNPVVQVDSFGQDDAATPTSSVPGELTYTLGGTPINTEYKPKYNT
jgi:hypothetical protein